MKNVNVNLSLTVNVNVDGQRVGGFSSGLPLGILAAACSGALSNGDNAGYPGHDDARDDEVSPASVADAAGTPDLSEASEEASEAATEAAAPAAAPATESAKQDHSAAEGSSGTNPQKLAWALDERFVVGANDEELYSKDDIEDETDTVYRVVDQYDASAVKFGNLYREAGGFAKLGSRRFNDRSSAASSGRGNNFISVVGLKRN